MNSCCGLLGSERKIGKSFGVAAITKKVRKLTAGKSQLVGRLKTKRSFERALDIGVEQIGSSSGS